MAYIGLQGGGSMNDDRVEEARLYAMKVIDATRERAACEVEEARETALAWASRAIWGLVLGFGCGVMVGIAVGKIIS